MKVKITSMRTEGSGMLVDFSCAAGNGAAFWKSKRITPVAGKEYDAELDIALVLQVGENAEETAGVTPGFELVGQDVQIMGISEQIDDDGIVYLRLSRDCIVVIESSGAPPKVGQMLRMVVKSGLLRLTAFS
jgi:hypothetical protein